MQPTDRKLCRRLLSAVGIDVYLCPSCDSLAVIDKRDLVQIATHKQVSETYNTAMYRRYAGIDMDPSYIDFLRVNRIFLIRNIQVKDNMLLDHLYSYGIINQNTMEKIQKLPSNQDQAKQLVNELETDTSRNFDGFLRALEETRQHDAADELRKRRQEDMDCSKSKSFHSHHVIIFPIFSFSLSCIFPVVSAFSTVVPFL